MRECGDGVRECGDDRIVVQYYYCLTFLLSSLCFADRKSCENLHVKPDDIAYNATSFVWCPKLVAKVNG